jgi:ABC-type oligopeptide transport system ATPase subunit
MTALLEAKDVTVTFRGRGAQKRAVDGVSLCVGGDVPRITAIVGESGSGKTTLTRLLLGFQEPTSGTVTYRGRPLDRMSGPERKQFRREVQAVFQDPFDVFNPFYKVDRALVKPLRAFGLARSAADAHAQAEQALADVGLRPLETLGRYPHQLSGGQRQRVMIARALLLKPKIILADEPVSMVDASLRATILQSLNRLKEEIGISLIYVTHDLTTAYQISDDVVVLYGGRIVEQGDAEAVIRRPSHAYTRSLVAAIPPPDPDKPWGESVFR